MKVTTQQLKKDVETLKKYEREDFQVRKFLSKDGIVYENKFDIMVCLAKQAIGIEIERRETMRKKNMTFLQVF